jgi:phosphoribosylformylglycinamidine cyclo-ligase
LRASWPVPPVLLWLQKLSGIEPAEMDTVFPTGIGFVIIGSPYDAESIQRHLHEDRVPTYVIGEVRAGQAGGGVR